MKAVRGKLVRGGWLQIPAQMQHELGLQDGGIVIMETLEGELRVRPFGDVLAEVQKSIRQYVPEGVSLSDELIADRRAEAERE